MNLLDLVILIPVVWLCIRGFSKGLIIELASLIGLVLGLLAAHYYSAYLENFIKDYFTFSERTLRVIAYIIILLGVMLVVYLIGKALEGVINLVAMGWLNKLLGAIIGLAKGVILVGIIFYVIEKADPGNRILKPEVKEKSMFYQPVMQAVHLIVP